MTQTFTDVFRERIAKIEADAKAKGLNWTTICQKAGMSRSTPDRWKRRPPKTISVITEVERIVAEHPAQ